MLNKLKLINFQSHKDSTLEFNRGVNIIVGESDSGKSSILRGLKLAIYNEPNGDAYRSNWGGGTSVELEVDNKIITRTKTNSKNLYELSDFDEPFAAFGQTVPDEIKEVLNMDEINLQQQLDSPFLISETSGKVALHFNKIAKLDKIDRVQSKVQKEINTINSETKHRQKELEIKEDKLKEFPDLKKLEKALIKIETLETTKQEKENQVENLNKLCNQITGIKQEIILCEKEVQAENSINVILELYQKERIRQDALKGLSILIDRIIYYGNLLNKYQNQVKAEASIHQILKLYENKQKVTVSGSKLKKLYINSNQINKELTSKEIELSILEKIYKKEFPKVCPLCNSKIK